MNGQPNSQKDTFGSIAAANVRRLGFWIPVAMTATVAFVLLAKFDLPQTLGVPVTAFVAQLLLRRPQSE